MDIKEIKTDELKLELRGLAQEIEGDISDERLAEIDERTKMISNEIEAREAEERAAIEKEEKRQALLAKVRQEGTVIERQEENIMEKRTFGIETMEYREAYLKNLQGKEIDVEERAAVSAASVIPTITLNKIVEKLEQYSVLYPLIDVQNVAGGLSVPTEGTNSDASWLAAGSASTDSADSFGSITFTANKLIKTIEINADVTAMSIDAFEAFVVDKISKKMAKAIEKAIIKGSGNGEPAGIDTITWSTASNEVLIASTGSVGYDDVCSLVACLPESYAQNAVVICNRNMLYGTIAKIKASTAGLPMFVMNREDGFAGKLLGYPVITNEYCGTDEMYIGDMKEYMLNWAKPVEITADGSVGFRSGSTVYRGLALADGHPIQPAAFAKLCKATS